MILFAKWIVTLHTQFVFKRRNITSTRIKTEYYRMSDVPWAFHLQQSQLWWWQIPHQLQWADSIELRQNLMPFVFLNQYS